MNAHALPSGIDDANSKLTLQRAWVALKGHPAATKVALLAGESTDGKPVTTVYVAPLKAKTKAKLKTITAPRCDLLSAATNEVNSSIDALAILADSLLEEMNYISELYDAHAAYTLAHASEIALAREGLAKIAAAEATVTELLAMLLIETDPELIQLYNAELVIAQRAVSDARNDPKYMSAFSIKTQADAMMDYALRQYEDWDTAYSVKLESINAALNAAQTLYDDLSSTVIAAVDARLPVWDPDVVSLLTAAGGIRGGIRFVAANLENLTWSMQDAEMPRMTPIQIELYGESAQRLYGSSRFEALPGYEQLDAIPRESAGTSEEHILTSTIFAEGMFDRTFSRVTASLIVPSPLVHASVNMGSYCGSLYSFETVPSVASGFATSASLHVTRYGFRPRQRYAIETYLGTVDYKIKVEGRRSRVSCSLDLPTYASVSRGKPLNVDWLWRRFGEWDEVLIERLRRIGIQCTIDDPSNMRFMKSDNYLRENLAWAVSDLLALAGQIAASVSPKSLGLETVKIESNDTRLAGQSTLCREGVCTGPALPFASASSSILGARFTGQCTWTSPYWKSYQLSTQIDFEMPLR
jgi:hypothetical protein